MNLDNIPEQSKKLMNQVTNAVEETGKKVASSVSNLTDGKAEEVTEEAIKSAVDNALDVMQIAGERVREKNINGERVGLEISVEIAGITRLKITTDVPGKESVEVED